ncbi:hypothetical protein O3M35_007255 [Rhynocoris fuscipes]|uniref:CHHC U11-48K-type domain-containing protein n=1 Tax=Rhynocoris fuscipes TaxID=488301 RepID=A0AAW1DBG5_9HEMI
MPNYAREVEVVQCPFNKSHVVRSHRIQYHIVKCLKNYKGSKVPCPFNASEYIDPDEMMMHLGQCPYRMIRETHFFYSRSCVANGYPPSTPFLHDDLPQSDENWGIDSPDEDG